MTPTLYKEHFFKKKEAKRYKIFTKLSLPPYSCWQFAGVLFFIRSDFICTFQLSSGTSERGRKEKRKRNCKEEGSTAFRHTTQSSHQLSRTGSELQIQSSCSPGKDFSEVRSQVSEADGRGEQEREGGACWCLAPAEGVIPPTALPVGILF